MNQHSENICKRLQAEYNAEKAKWLENYVKHGIKSLGVGIPEIRNIVKSYDQTEGISQESLDLQISFLNDLMKREYTECKLAAILFIQLFWKTEKAKEILALSSDWLDQNLIYDWNVCDWLCVRLLSRELDNHPGLILPQFKNWNRSPNPWKARASLVPFAQCKTLVAHETVILRLSKVLIKREERFCKTAVGWVLRQYSKLDRKLVTEFLDEHKEWTTKEVVRNATKYF